MPVPVIANAQTARDPHQPEIEEARFAQARNRTQGMDHQRRCENPRRLEDEKQLGGDHTVEHEERIGHSSEHLGARQRNEKGLTFEDRHGLGSIPRARRSLNAGDDTCSSEQDEAAKNDRRAIAPVHPACEHHEAN